MYEPVNVKRLTGAAGVPLMRAMNALFGRAFEEPHTFGGASPDDAYLADKLSREHIIALAAISAQGEVLGGLVAYELDKLEQARREVYIYDLAVDAAHRRQGVATALIQHLTALAKQRGAWAVFVQADYVDPPAIALYTKLGVREDVLHFDLHLPPLP